MAAVFHKRRLLSRSKLFPNLEKKFTITSITGEGLVGIPEFTSTMKATIADGIVGIDDIIIDATIIITDIMIAGIIDAVDVEPRPKLG